MFILSDLINALLAVIFEYYAADWDSEFKPCVKELVNANGNFCADFDLNERYERE